MYAEFRLRNEDDDFNGMYAEFRLQNEIREMDALHDSLLEYQFLDTNSAVLAHPDDSELAALAHETPAGPTGGQRA